jgi:hypothetical protein
VNIERKREKPRNLFQIKLALTGNKSKTL